MRHVREFLIIKIKRHGSVSRQVHAKRQTQREADRVSLREPDIRLHQYTITSRTNFKTLLN